MRPGASLPNFPFPSSRGETARLLLLRFASLPPSRFASFLLPPLPPPLSFSPARPLSSRALLLRLLSLPAAPFSPPRSSVAGRRTFLPLFSPPFSSPAFSSLSFPSPAPSPRSFSSPAPSPASSPRPLFSSPASSPRSFPFPLNGLSPYRRPFVGRRTSLLFVETGLYGRAPGAPPTDPSARGSSPWFGWSGSVGGGGPAPRLADSFRALPGSGAKSLAKPTPLTPPRYTRVLTRRPTRTST